MANYFSWQVDDDPTGVEAALIGAAQLGRAGIDVEAMLATGDAIILEATLGFFGLGAQPPTPSWGGMMSSGSGLLFKGPWIILFPGLCIALTVVAINLFGDALLHKLDIRERVRSA